MYWYKNYKALIALVILATFSALLLIYVRSVELKFELTSSKPVPTPRGHELSFQRLEYPAARLESTCEIPLVLILCDENRNGSSPCCVSEDFNRQINQTLVLLKSLLITLRFSDRGQAAAVPCVRVILVSEQRENFEAIKERIFEVENWDPGFTQFFKLSFVQAFYPPGTEWMRKLFRPCATLRLFLPDLLPSYDSLIYVDTDFIFVRSIVELWTEFKSFSDLELAGMAPCLFHYGTPKNRVPFYGRTGLNAGVMLMNSRRMRETQWTHKIRMVTSMFKTQIRLADQDILNIYFHSHPAELHLLSCKWNFRPFQCRSGSSCEAEDPSLLSDGISALHGNALSFTANGPDPLFQAVFRVFQTTQLHSSFSLRSFIEDLEAAMLVAEEGSPGSDCVKYGGFNVVLLNGLQRLLPQD